MKGQVLRIADRTPRIEMEIRSLIARNGFADRYDKESELFAVLDTHGAVRGIASALQDEEICLLNFVVVREDARGAGIGSNLVNHVLGFFSDRCKRAYAWGDRGRIYLERFGFKAEPAGDLPVSVTGRVPREAGADAGGSVPVLMLPLAGRWSMG